MESKYQEIADEISSVHKKLQHLWGECEEARMPPHLLLKFSDIIGSTYDLLESIRNDD